MYVLFKVHNAYLHTNKEWFKKPQKPGCGLPSDNIVQLIYVARLDHFNSLSSTLHVLISTFYTFIGFSNYRERLLAPLCNAFGERRFNE